MEALFYVLLLLLGMMFGSFASVIIYRLKSGEGGIWGGRSHCKDCKRNLSVIELLPVVSWIVQKGKCLKCKKKISAIYPTLEITSGLLFLAIGFFLSSPSAILSGDIISILKLSFLLFIAFLTIIYVFYDILFLEIPESILLIANISIFLILILLDGGNIGIGTVAIGAIVLSGLYLIMIKGFKEIYDCLILGGCILLVYLYIQATGIGHHASFLISGIIGALGIFSFFFAQILVSQGKWMGGGDLRIAILMGLSLGITLSFAGVMLSYFIGSIICIGMVVIAKWKKGWNTTFESKIPFGPFLASGYFGALFFSQQILHFINYYL